MITIRVPQTEDEIEKWNFSPASMAKSCQSVGMDCDDLVFTHCDLGPRNVIAELDSENGKVDGEVKRGVKWES